MTDDIEFMDRVQLKTEIRRLRDENTQVRAVIQSWLDQQGHNRCWYYPELFRQLVQILHLTMTVEPALPPRCEFRAGCQRYEGEEYGNDTGYYINKILGSIGSIILTTIALVGYIYLLITLLS
jgi:hypothetical protein